MRQLSPPLRHLPDSEVELLFSHLLLLRLLLSATGTRVERSRMVTDGWRAVGGERISGDDGKLLLLFEEKTSAGALSGVHEAEHIWAPNKEKATWLPSWRTGFPQRANQHLTLSPSGTIFTQKPFQRIVPPLIEGDWLSCFFFKWKKNKQTNEKKERDSRHKQINSRQAALRLWARSCRILTRRLSSHPGTEGVM